MILKVISKFLLAFLIAAQVVPAGAADYYVDPATGNDANAGTSGSPWLTLQRCVNTVGVSPDLVAGDNCIAKNGTYTDLDGDGKIVITGANSPLGQIGLPVTIKAQNYLGAVLVLGHQDDANNDGDNVAFYLTRNYYVIEGFEIKGDGLFTINNGTTVDFDGITVSGSIGHVIRRNKFHDIGRECVKNANWGFNGIGGNGSSVTVEYNEFYNIGRLRFNENGCNTSRVNYQNDHGGYMSGSNNIFRYNVFYGDHRGYPLHLYGGTTTSISIYNNTSYGIPLDDPPRAHYLLGSVWAGTSNIKNNVFGQVNFAPFIACCTGANGITGSGVINIDENLTDNNVSADWFHGNVPTQVSGGAVGAGSQFNTATGFVDGAGSNFNLATGSAAIDSGVDVGLPFNGSAPDKGAFETFTCTSGTATGNVATLQCNMSLHTPLIPGTTGYSVTVDVGGGDVARTVTGVALSGSSAAAITFNGAALAAGNVIKVSYTTTTGTASDSALVGGHLNQRLNSLGPITLTNIAGGAAYTLTQTAGGIYEAFGAQSTTRLLTEVKAGGMIAVRTKWKATGGDPPSLTTKFQCAVDGENGTYADVPDAFTAGNCPNLRYAGQSNLPGMEQHGVAVSTERLASEFGSMVSGGVVRCASGCEVPAVDLAQDSETEEVDIVEFDTDTTAETIYHFRRVQSDGTVLTYAASSKPSITIKAPSASGFAQADQPTGLTVTPNPTLSRQPSRGSLASAGGSLSSVFSLAANGLR